MKKLLVLLAGFALLTGCATKNQPYDYTALKESKPKSILMVMPVNNSVDAKAEASVLARATYPLAELGYYVYPVSLVDAVFKQNGLTDGHSIRSASLKKIHEIFGADTVFYVNVNEYGTSFQLIDSVTTVKLEGKLVDVKTGKTLWEGEGAFSQGTTGGNLNIIGVLVNAAINQIINTATDRGYKVAEPAMNHLLYHGKNGGLLVGPKHPNYNKPQK